MDPLSIPLESAFTRKHKRNPSLSEDTPLLKLMSNDVTPSKSHILNPLHTTEGNSFDYIANSDFEEDTLPFEVTDQHQLNKLHIDHHFLLHQNRTLIKELQFAKVTAQALRLLLSQKEEELATLANSIEKPKCNEISSVNGLDTKVNSKVVRRDSVTMKERIRFPFRAKSRS